ncbi:MAG: type II toxin-antitoxin system HicA family toxin [Caldilineaceae bacterium]|nr:type II toxin-antitoxin system HicA family toxin [Caldilineaceae bacterium]
MPRLPMVTPREMIALLQQLGFIIDHQTGSHVVLRRESDGLRVVVPWHNRDLGRGLTLRIIKSAGLSRDDFLGLLDK